jgi:hypothetical protein
VSGGGADQSGSRSRIAATVSEKVARAGLLLGQLLGQRRERDLAAELTVARTVDLAPSQERTS